MTASLYKKFKESAEHSLERRRLFKLLKELKRISDILVNAFLISKNDVISESDRAVLKTAINVSILNAKFVTDELSEFKALYNKTIDILNTGLTKSELIAFDIPEKIEEDYIATDGERRRKILNHVYIALDVDIPEDTQAEPKDALGLKL